MKVTWGGASPQNGSGHAKLFHSGPGRMPIEGPLPPIGAFYGITSDGNLDWSRYNESAQSADSAWHPNTKNLIGNGWGNVLHAIGCGEGVILAVKPDGLLYWFKYEGNGESNVSASHHWHANSGNVIGRGWANVERIFAGARTGQGGNHLVICAVEKNGDLRWFSYQGNGAHDPTASNGWHPNSGNTIGNGWQNMRHVWGSGSEVFAVAPNGDLRWYSYRGTGANDPSGYQGWHANSGNVIANGWQKYRHVFGGVSDVGGFAHIIMAVTDTGELHWHRYTGNGEQDIAGTSGWDQRSGTMVGEQW
jgi:hypothetical protein